MADKLKELGDRMVARGSAGPMDPDTREAAQILYDRLKAAAAMLAALEEYRRCGLRNDAADAAIAQAKAAGITTP